MANDAPDRSFPSQEEFLAAARKDFAAFYASADEEDVAAMDSLVLARAVLVVMINVPRPNLPPPLRDHMERATDSLERHFTDLREAVRVCPTFV